MSIKVIDLVWLAQINSTTKLVALRLADFADDDGRKVFPSNGRIVTDTGLSERAVRDAVRRLAGLGVLVLVALEDPATHRAREYRIDLERLAALAKTKPTATGAPRAPHPGSTCPPGGHDVPPPPAPRAPLPGHHVPPEPSENPSVEPSVENLPVNPAADLFGLAADEPAPDERDESDVDAAFAQWWEVVPAKKAKAAALRAFRAALKHASPAELLAGIQRYAAEVAGRDPRYIKHPSTWLNGGCWQDEAAPLHGGSNAEHRKAGPPIRNGFIADRLTRPGGGTGDADTDPGGWHGPAIDLEPAGRRVE